MQPRIFRRTRFRTLIECALLLASVFAAQASEFHVALSGQDSNRGSRWAPFASLERARGEVRSLKQHGGLPPDGVTVWIHSGDYARASTFELGADDVVVEFSGQKLKGRELSGILETLTDIEHIRHSLTRRGVE